jgi:hypothetical protein
MSIERIEVGANRILHDPEQPPFFTHDCEDCIHLTSTSFGRHFGMISAEKFDLYYCPPNSVESEGTIVKRSGNEPPNYSSGLCFARSAFKRAENEWLDFKKTRDRHQLVLALGYHLALDKIADHDRAMGDAWVENSNRQANEKALNDVQRGYYDLNIAFKNLWKESYVWNKKAFENFESLNATIEDENNPLLTAMYDATLAFAQKESQ